MHLGLASFFFLCISTSQAFVVHHPNLIVGDFRSVIQFPLGSRPHILSESRSSKSADCFPSLHMAISRKAASGDQVTADNQPVRRFRFPKFNVTSAQVASMGASAALSYGAVSNLNMGICAMMAYATFGKTTGLSPLAPGAMPKFAAVYGGYWLAMNFLRPARLALAMSISPLFDRFMVFMQNKFHVSKPAAFGLVVFLVNVVGNLTFLISGLFLTSRIIGIPLLP
jgi:hypothetical protein